MDPFTALLLASSIGFSAIVGAQHKVISEAISEKFSANFPPSDRLVINTKLSTNPTATTQVELK